MIRRLKLFWKLSLIALLVPLSVGVGMAVSRQGTRGLEAEYDHLYGFMLVPLMSLGEAHTRLEALDGDLRELTRADLTPERRRLLALQVRENDQLMTATLARYRKEWLSTLSPDFTVSVESLGQRSLQAEETEALQLFESSYAAYAPLRDQLLEGTPVAMAELKTRLANMDAAMASLVATNHQFADLSKARARVTVERMDSQLHQTGLLLSLACIGLAWGLSRLMSRPLESLIRLTSRAARGEVELPKEGAWEQPDPHARDEVGTLMRSTWDLVHSTERMALAASALSQGDLTVSIEPRSEKDVLGNALSRMVTRVPQLLSEVRESAAALRQASSEVFSLTAEVGMGAHRQLLHVADISPGLVRVLSASLQQTSERCSQLEQLALEGEQELEQAERSGHLARGRMPSLRKLLALVKQVADASRYHDMCMSQLRQELEHLGSGAASTTEDAVELGTTVEKMGACAQTLLQLTDLFRVEPGAGPA